MGLKYFRIYWYVCFCSIVLAWCLLLTSVAGLCTTCTFAIYTNAFVNCVCVCVFICVCVCVCSDLNDTHLPGLTESAHCWVAHAHDDGEEGVEIPELPTAETHTHTHTHNRKHKHTHTHTHTHIHI